MRESQEVTLLLERWAAGDGDAFGSLLPFLYDELRRVAAIYMSRQQVGHTLQPTALIHEVYLKLAEQQNLSFENRASFLGLAAKAMRRVLVDHARARQADKRGGEDAVRVTMFDGLVSNNERPADITRLDDALEVLAKHDPRKSRIVELRYFGGLTGEEIALAVGIGSATVTRELRLAEAWLHREMTKN